jgi:hypothetical protein
MERRKVQLGDWLLAVTIKVRMGGAASRDQ